MNRMRIVKVCGRGCFVSISPAKSLRLLLVLVLLGSAYGQEGIPKVQRVLDAVVAKAKETSLYSSSVNWDLLEKRIYSESGTATSVDELKPAFEALINGLRDHHGRILGQSDFRTVAHFTDSKNRRFFDKRPKSSQHWSIVNDTTARFEYAVLPGNIGYLKVVLVGPNLDGQKESTRIRNALRELDRKKIVKWIVDLRYNSGGNVNVMMSGLAPLFDAEQVASVRGDDDQTVGVAEIRQGEFWYFGTSPFQIKDKTRISEPRIAVLTSRWTVSSGELVAVAFKGQKNTRFFGEATGGYTTNTGWELIDDQVVLVIATGVFTDRNGISYEENVKPDTEIPFEISKDSKKDKTIAAAAEWLQDKTPMR